MKILLEGMTSSPGGLETFVMTLFRHMDRTRYQFDFLYYDEHIAYEDELRLAGCGLYKITKRSKNYFVYKKQLARLFAKGQYDVFWSNKTALSAIEPFVAAKEHGVLKIICHSHSSKNMGSIFTYLMHRMHRCMIGRYITDRFACSDVAAQWFFGGNERVTIVRNAVDTDAYRYNPGIRSQIRESLGLKCERVVGHIGRFSPEKNHRFLLEIFSRLHKEHPDTILLLCGDGPDIAAVKAQAVSLGISDSVRFLGIRKDIPQLLQAIDVFVMPSLFEGLPFVLVEAQAAGLPCLVADTVSPQAKLTERLKFRSLKDDVKIWVDEIVELSDMEKTDTSKEIEKAGYGVKGLIRFVEDNFSNIRQDM